MNRKSFLSSLLALIAAPFVRRAKAEPACDSEIKRLEAEYVTVSLRLYKYRQDHGFMPGTRVEFTCIGGKVMRGTIAPYGDMWQRCSAYYVPVVRDDTKRDQPWNMSELTKLR